VNETIIVSNETINQTIISNETDVNQTEISEPGSNETEVFVNETNRYQARTEAAKKLIEKRKNVVKEKPKKRQQRLN